VHAYKLVNDGEKKEGGDNKMERNETTMTVAIADGIAAV
jgi:hypothetical protein